MYFSYDNELVKKAKKLRQNMTPEECKLWYHFLKGYLVRFQRQKTLDHYILDFYCAKAKLCVEIDGNQHLSVGGMEHDAVREGKLAGYGITTIRFSNDQIGNEFEEVCRQIDLAVHRLVSE